MLLPKIIRNIVNIARSGGEITRVFIKIQAVREEKGGTLRALRHRIDIKPPHQRANQNSENKHQKKWENCPEFHVLASQGNGMTGKREPLPKGGWKGLKHYARQEPGQTA